MSNPFNINLDKLTKEIQGLIDERIDSEKKRIIGAVIGDLFAPESYFHKKGGSMHQLLREKIEALSLEAMVTLDEEKLKRDFTKVFNQYYDEHLPKAIDRVARKVAQQAAERAAKEMVKK